MSLDYLDVLVTKVVDNAGDVVTDIKSLNGFERVSEVKSFTREEKLLIFQDELNEIKNYDVKNIAISMLENLPETFWYKSNYSEYGNTLAEEKNLGGNIIHTKKAFEIAVSLAKAWGLSDYKRDIVLAAVILHDAYLDSFTAGEAEDEELLHLHLIKPRIKFLNYQYLIGNKENEDAFNLIMEGIEGHTGESCLIPSLRYKKENDFLKIVHLADFMANTRG